MAALGALVTLAAVAHPAGATSSEWTSGRDAAEAVATIDTVAPIATNDFLDTERDLSECISAAPKPGCGREPTHAGDRGGSLQLVLFGLVVAAMAGIGWRIVASVRARGRAANAG